MSEPFPSRAPGPEPGHASDPPSGRSPGWQPSLVGRVALEVATVSWPAPEEIRARARRRNRIRTVAGTVAVVVAVTAGSVGLVERYGGHPRPVAPPASAPTPAPDPVAIPPSALLQPGDVGPGLVVDRVNVWADAAVDLIDPTVVIDCPGYGAYDRYDGLARMFRRHTVQKPPTVPGDPLTGQAVVHEKVFRLAPDAARRVFADARAVPDLCARYVSSGVIEIDGRRLPVDAEHRWRVLAEGFAGDESVLLEWQTTIRRRDGAAVVDGPAGRLVGVARVGDLVAAVDRVDEVPDPQRARALTLAAAARLCDVANPPC
ncbi:hypothetical protein [Plantactinospora sp. KLBMP9567]|uniref:hypothetical protein n=1 Tax=Plantactinospora sp. KLBMP9567 TaxID=3085900 RepID=UPI00298233E7|nr:hypothetical protein [Plantactinospora sp. KLBMP9567]MDW5326342.1 hypothetical protein [Plantactinospora sp. KLBMP9567]